MLNNLVKELHTRFHFSAIDFEANHDTDKTLYKILEKAYKAGEQKEFEAYLDRMDY